MFQKAIHRARASIALEPQWLVHQLRRDASSGRLEPLFTGTTIKHFTGSSLRKYEVTLPPLNEQRRIVAKLEALLARSRRAKEALEAVPALLERFRQSVLAAAFRGDLTRDWREKNREVEPINRVLDRVRGTIPAPRNASGETQRTMPGQFALSVGNPGLSAPRGWRWTKLTEVARLESGHTPSRSHPEYWDGGFQWIGIKDARENHGKVIEATLQTVTQKGLDNSAARTLPANTVCLSRTASVGYVLVMGRPMATSQDFVNWVCSEAVVPKFLMYLLMAEGDEIRRFGEGSTHTTIYFPEVLAFHVCLPPVAEQRRIIEEVEQRFSAASRIRAAWEAAHERSRFLDQAILAKAFRGELVPQDPADEPAPVLLERIRAERNQAEQVEPLPRAKRQRASKVA